MEYNDKLQANNIEAGVTLIIENQNKHIQMDMVDIIHGFYENEILNESGELHYLAKDEKLKNFIESLGKEEEVLNEEIDLEEKKFENRPFE